ncbi:hypothetical protein AAFF_G00170710 [Aldrovandia affinis]|uniref:G-protein coupled receptors family 1 profile domain-containing protein n=1 Tax=Aldrovandia affinis TaxID=143900 RepID=A0AAD7W6T6_9TELE|nr:hypothetical protein AAFF_G00170710 [Aldrovandia affinis]
MGHSAMLLLLLLALGAAEPRSIVLPEGDAGALDRATGVSPTEPARLNARNNFVTSESLGDDDDDDSATGHRRVPRGAKGASTKKRDQQTPFSHRYPRPHDPSDYFTTPTIARLSNATRNREAGGASGVTRHGGASGATFGQEGAGGNATERGGSTTRIHNPLYPLTDGSYGAYALLLLSLAVFSVGIVGNLAVMCVVWHNYYMKSAWNCILASLAFWDFAAVVFCLPVVIFNELTHKRLLGDFSCRIVTSLGVSTFGLCALGIDRLHATVSSQPKARSAVEPCRSILAKLGVVWVGSLVLAVPELLLWQLSQDWSPAAGGLVDCCLMSPSPDLPESLYSLVLTYHDARMWWRFGCYLCLPILFTLVCQLVTRHVGAGGEARGPEGRQGSPKKAQQQSQPPGRQRERRLNGTVVALCAVYGVCALPESAAGIALAYAAAPVSAPTADLLELVAHFFLFLKSAATPVLLLCLCRALGRAFLDCCCCCCEGCGPQPSLPGGTAPQGKLKASPADMAPSIFFDKAKDSSSILAIGTTC